MQRRLLPNGQELLRAKSPTGNGYVYYMDSVQGPAFLWDSASVPQSILNQCESWENDEEEYREPDTPALEFNKRGMRL